MKPQILKHITFEKIVYLGIIGSFLLMIFYPLFTSSSTIELECLFKKMTGYPCPTCGMTRSFKQLIAGHFLESIRYNLFTFPIYIFYGYLAFRAVVALLKRQAFTISSWMAWLFFATLVAAWMWKFYVGESYY